MKRGKPLQRRTPLTRTARKPAGRKPLDQVRAEVDKEQTGNAKQRRSARQREDAQWRAEVLALRGPYCRSCGSIRDVQVDHLVGRVGEDRLAIANGTPLCGDFGDQRCHPRKTEHQLLIQRHWLDPDQVTWLEENRYAIWEPDGTVSGTHCTLFAETRRN